MMTLETSDLYDLSLEIEKAIEARNIIKLQELLRLETPLSEQGVFYLMTAIDNFLKDEEEPTSIIIIEKLLYFGADPLAVIPNNSHYRNPLNYAQS